MESAVIQSRNIDEIDLIDMFYSFKDQKWLIFFSSFIGVLLGFYAIFFHKPYYESVAWVLPPTLAEVENFNYRGSKIQIFSPNQVFDVFAYYLLSESTKRTFFTRFLLPTLSKSEVSSTSQNELYQKYLMRISINPVNGKYRVSIKSHDMLQSTQLLRQYILLAKQESLDEILDIVKKQSQGISRGLKNDIQIAQAVAQDMRQDRIIILNEAITIAKAMKSSNPSFFQTNKKLLNLAMLDRQNMLYLRGDIALKNEVALLQQRRSDEPFIPKLRFLQKKYDFYKNISLHPRNGQVFRFDGEISSSNFPLPPSNNLIFLSYCVIGFGLGIGLAIIRYIWGRQKLSQLRQFSE